MNDAWSNLVEERDQLRDAAEKLAATLTKISDVCFDEDGPMRAWKLAEDALETYRVSLNKEPK